MIGVLLWSRLFFLGFKTRYVAILVANVQSEEDSEVERKLQCTDNSVISNIFYYSEWPWPLHTVYLLWHVCSGLEDKASACEMLVCYARELNEGFAPYAEEVVKLMVPLLKFYFHDGVRSAAAESLPYLLECAKIKGEFAIAAKACFTW